MGTSAENVANRLSRDSTSNGKRVAVVAVHGVAYHEPGSSADAVSELLLAQRDRDGRPLYGPITAETIHIPLHPLAISQPLKTKKYGFFEGGLKFYWLRERTAFLTEKWKKLEAKEKEKAEKSDTEVADDFMRLALQDYRGASPKEPKDARDATAYNTTRLTTTRIGAEPAGLPTCGAAAPAGSGGNSGNPPDVGGADRAMAAPPVGAVGQERVAVDIYEMYWADLSRPKSSILSFFQALYQLLFHLASLSRLAITTGNLENGDLRLWRAVDRAQLYAVRMITLAIPMLNGFLLVALFGTLSRLLPGVDTHRAAYSAVAAVAIGIFGFLVYLLLFPKNSEAQGKPFAWALQPLIVALALAGFSYLLARNDFRHIVMFYEGLILGSPILIYTVAPFDEVRDGARESATILAILVVAATLCVWLWGGADSVDQATLWTVQILIAALRFSWLLFFLFSIASVALGLFVWIQMRLANDTARRARAVAALRTSHFALAMNTLGTLIVTLALWSGLFVKTKGQNGDYGNSIAAHLFGTTLKKPLTWSSPFFLDDAGVVPYLDQAYATVRINTEPVEKSTAVTVSADFQDNSGKSKTQTAQLIVNPQIPALTVNPPAVTGGMPSSATVSLDDSVPPGEATVKLSTDKEEIAKLDAKLLSFRQRTEAAADSTENRTSRQPNDYFQGLLVWNATPGFPVTLIVFGCALLLLIFWVVPSASTEGAANVPVRSTNPQSRKMGRWISRGLDSTKFVTGLAWFAAVLVPFVFGVFYSLKTPGRSGFIHWTTLILDYMGIGVTSAAVLAGLAGSGSVVLGIILDVDNYLRTSPSDDTPRARIMERYNSLLSYISKYKDPLKNEPYDRIVVVAHSLGALISADFFRFLKVQNESPQVEVYLFTMGNPLRQLLNRFFPYLYQWVRPTPDNGLQPLRDRPAGPTAPVIAATPNNPGMDPAPASLGVARWVSAYRSGDYVGRSLWLDEWYSRTATDPGATRDNPSCVASQVPPDSREELCIGAGAHTHYWDPSAPDIAIKLDELIVR
jgi:hypothetical protein